MDAFQKKWLVSAVAVVALGGCLGNDDAPIVPESQQGVIVTSAGNLVTINNANGAVIDSVALTGIPGTEAILDADFRHADGRLWILTRIGTVGKLYSVAGTAATERSTLSLPLDATASYSIDFNPQVDRLRIIGALNENWAVNVENGAVTAQTAINGPNAPTTVSQVAYTDTFTNTGRQTALFNLDEINDVLYAQTAVASGTQVQQSVLGVNAVRIFGFDLPVDSTTGLALMNVGGQLGIYNINTSATTNAASLIGTVNLTGGQTAVAFAQRKSANPTVIGVTANNEFFQFRYQNPATISDRTAATGLAMGENIVGIDYSTNTGDTVNRPQSLYVLTLNNVYQASNTGALTGARPLSAALPAINYSIDFNPSNGGLRVVGDDDTNYAITLAAAAATVATQAPVTPNTRDLLAHAYENSVAGNAAPTRLLAADATAREFVQQAVPAATTTSLNAIPFALVRNSDFDIRYNDNAVVLFASKQTTNAPLTLYSASSIVAGGINLGAAIGQIGGTAGPNNVVGLAIAQ